MCALAYFYMVTSWGGYVFLINLIPLHVLALMITGRFSHRILVSYSTVYCLGTILSMQISFVGFQPVQSRTRLPLVWCCSSPSSSSPTPSIVHGSHLKPTPHPPSSSLPNNMMDHVSYSTTSERLTTGSDRTPQRMPR